MKKKGQQGLSWGEIIIGVLFIIYSIPSPEQAFGEAILGISKGMGIYPILHLLVILLPILGFLALVDGIARKFDSDLGKIIKYLIGLF